MKIDRESLIGYSIWTQNAAKYRKYQMKKQMCQILTWHRFRKTMIMFFVIKVMLPTYTSLSSTLNGIKSKQEDCLCDYLWPRSTT